VDHQNHEFKSRVASNLKVEKPILCYFSFKLNTDSFIKSIYYTIYVCLFFRKLINWEQKVNFNEYKF